MLVHVQLMNQCVDTKGLKYVLSKWETKVLYPGCQCAQMWSVLKHRLNPGANAEQSYRYKAGCGDEMSQSKSTDLIQFVYHHDVYSTQIQID